MDPITAGVISGLIVNALSGLEKPMARSVRRDASRIEQRLKEELERASSKYRTRLVSHLPSITLKAPDEAKFIAFLNGALSRYAAQAVAIEIMAGRSDDDATAMQEHIAAMIALSANMHEDTARDLADLYYRSVSSVYVATLEALREKFPKEYALIREAAKREQEAGYLKSLAYRTGLLRRLQAHDVIQAHQFIQDYISLVHSRAAVVAPAHLSEQHSVPLKDLYVKPHFMRTGATDQEGGSDFDSFVGSIYRDVVLGDPGAGKSTMAQKIAHDLTASQRSNLIPFVISLRDLQAYQKLSHDSIVSYIETYMREEFSLSPPSGVVDFLLASGRALVIFDGLDELIDTYKKRQMRNTLETFAELYAPSSILVTSRVIGYFEAPMQGRGFRVSTLASFTVKQAESYVRNWFHLDVSLTEQQRNGLISSFMTESSSIKDLRANPLMLSLLCNIYRGVGSIPRSRAELYQQCALLLFDRWDAQRGIMAPGTLRGDARLALQAIALWVYESPDSMRTVRHNVIRKRLQEFLLESRYEDEARAYDVAEDLLQLWRGRAWVLTDCGTTPNGEPVYGFSHQTFLEYFAGVELTRRNPSPEGLWGILRPHVAKEEWDVVAQISIQTLDAFYDRGTDRVIALLINDADSSDVRERLMLLRFASRYIEALTPGPALCRLLTRSCIRLALIGQPVFPYMPRSDQYIDQFVAAIDRECRVGEAEVNVGPEELVSPLREILDALNEPRSCSRSEFGLYLRKIVERGDMEIGTKALVLALNEHYLIKRSSGAPAEESPRIPHAGKGLSTFSSNEISMLLELWGDSNFWIPMECARQGYLDLSIAVRSYGIGLLFCAQSSINMDGGEEGPWEPIAVSLIKELVEGRDALKLRTATPQVLKEIAAGFRAALRDKGFAGIDSVWLAGSDLESIVVEEAFYEDMGYADDEQNADLNDADETIPGSFRALREGDPFTFDDHQGVPYMDLLDGDGGNGLQRDDSNGEDLAANMNQDAFFGAFCLLAVLVESEKWSFTDYGGLQTRLNLGLLQRANAVIMARLRGSGKAAIMQMVSRLGLCEADRSTLVRWASGHLSLVVQR